MVGDDTLMAYLVPLLTNQVEVAATRSLAFILNKSESCRRALERLLDNSGPQIARYTAEEAITEGSRLDLVGYDDDEVRRLLVEAKFWASLGTGQASGYIKLLDADRSGVLLFVCPHTRLESLWAEVKRQLSESDARLDELPPTAAHPVRRARLSGTSSLLMMVSWATLLQRMAQESTGHPEVLSDIQQLQGLAERQDAEAFQPLPSQDLGPEIARRVRHLNRMVDDAVAIGVREGWLSRQTISGARLVAQSQPHGYGGYFRFVDAQRESWFGVDQFVWGEHGHTPLWVRIYAKDAPAFRSADHLFKVRRGGGLRIPIYLETGAEYDHVLAGVVAQLREVGSVISEHRRAPAPSDSELSSG